MPMYYPDLNSVKRLAEVMQQQPDNAKKYKGIVPVTEDELPVARIIIGDYMRKVWNDEIAALEIELALDQSNYNKKLQEYIAGVFRI